MNAWLILGFCILAEVAATTLLTKSEGFNRPLYGIVAIIMFCGCFWAMSHVLTRIPVGVAYAMWSGLGLILISVAGWLVLGQPLTLSQILCVTLIMAGVAGLNLSTAQSGG